MAFVEKYVSVTGGGLHDGTSEANAWTMAEAVTAINGGAPGGWRVNIKGLGYSGYHAISVGGTDTSWLWLRGYGTTIGDGVKAGAVIGDSLDFSIGVISGSNIIVSDMQGNYHSWISSVFNMAAKHGVLIDCVALNNAVDQDNRTVVNVENGSSAISIAAEIVSNLGVNESCLTVGNGSYVGCSATCNGWTGVINGAGGLSTIIGAVISGASSSDGIYSSGNRMAAIGNTVSDCDAAIRKSLQATSGTDIQLAINNLIDNCTNGIVASTANKTGMTVSHNCIGRITSNRYDLGDTPIAGDQVHTRDPFQDAANGDYRPNGIEGGGLVPRNKALEPER